jgi:hypothetical protein
MHNASESSAFSWGKRLRPRAHWCNCVSPEMVEQSGICPAQLNSKRNGVCGGENSALRPEMNGAMRIRTADPLNAIEVLYQLSYSPVLSALIILTR